MTEVINWAVDREGRKDQIRAQLRDLSDQTQTRWIELHQKTQAIEQLEQSNKGRLEVAARQAYDKLQEVVQALLEVENGSRALSRSNTDIFTALEQSADAFQNLSNVAKLNTSEMGVDAGDCMALGDATETFIEQLSGVHDTLHGTLPHISDVVEQRRGVCDGLKQRSEQLENRVNDAQESLNDFGNQILGVFDFTGSTNDRLQNDLKDAYRRLEENYRDREEAGREVEEFESLAQFHAESIVEVLGFQEQLRLIAERFDVQYKKLTSAQTIENRFWEELLRLKDYVCQTNYTSTRNSSLRIILQLLKADDDTFHRQEYYEMAQAAIESQIVLRLGKDALERIQNGTEVVKSGVLVSVMDVSSDLSQF